MTSTMKTFSFRFDIDSLADIEIGVPKLIEMAKELDIRFTFFVNMGKSFNRKTIFSVKQSKRRFPRHARTLGRLGLWRTLRTVLLNPDIGTFHKKYLFRLLDDGHELGLHGGMDHPLWQWKLDEMSKDDINRLIRPAYERFTSLFGRPNGFSSPGFRYNSDVLKLIDDYGFKYASDMDGEMPFIPEGFSSIQIPVNIKGADNSSIMEYLLTQGFDDKYIVSACMDEIFKRDMSVIYGHPAFEGRAELLRDVLINAKDGGYDIIPMNNLAVDFIPECVP